MRERSRVTRVRGREQGEKKGEGGGKRKKKKGERRRKEKGEREEKAKKKRGTGEIRGDAHEKRGVHEKD